jgi:DNA-directed RNA polymerase II subunit RPB11
VNVFSHILASHHSAILAQPGVLFCGYRVPHPLEPRTEIRLQTDGEQTPQQVMKAACEALIKQCTDVKRQFEEQAKQLKGNMFGRMDADSGVNQGFTTSGYGGGGFGGTQYMAD